MLKKIILAIFIVFGLYLIISYFLLNGKLTYTTSFCSHSKIDSKKRKLFIKDNLKIDFDNRNLKLKKIIEENDIWIEKHYDVEYFGIIFNREVENVNYRKLRFDCKKNENCDMKVCDIIIQNDTIEKSTIFPNSQMVIRIREKVEYNVYEYNYGKKIHIGKLYVDTK
jgi:hypothetical protein